MGSEMCIRDRSGPDGMSDMSEMSHPYYVSSSDFVNDLFNNSKTNDRKINNNISQYCSIKMNLGLYVLIARQGECWNDAWTHICTKTKGSIILVPVCLTCTFGDWFLARNVNSQYGLKYIGMKS